MTMHRYINDGISYEIPSIGVCPACPGAIRRAAALAALGYYPRMTRCRCSHLPISEGPMYPAWETSLDGWAFSTELDNASNPRYSLLFEVERAGTNPDMQIRPWGYIGPLRIPPHWLLARY